MKSRMIIGVMVIALAAALIGGATMAWFTDVKPGGEAVFTAGSVKIEVEGGLDGKDNWNPGDSDCVCWEITSVGSKRTAIRIYPFAGWELDEEWLDYFYVNNRGMDEQEFEAMLAAWNNLSAAEKLANITITLCSEDCEACEDYDFDPADWNIVGSGDDINEYYVEYVGGNGYLEQYEEVALCLNIEFSGPKTSNIYQGATFTLGGEVRAIQFSHSDQWNWDQVDFVTGLPTTTF